ncbi:uncharacterized protein LOC121430771 [Lytechinus variegatus]|uniref:uncharacterized protein LOC121430771 n=1 Tax=Lytechinus variegatus TaxID=7654 RepID=UPI001BB112EE|nr:uncharacterized protein LOC121430771 [Lytechinus variegatus]
MGPKRGRDTTKKNQRRGRRDHVVEIQRARSPTPPQPEEDILVPEQPQPVIESGEDQSVIESGEDLPEIPSVSAARKRRKNKPYYYAQLKEAQKEELIDWLKQNPCIYSKRLFEYKDAPQKEKLWEDKAKAMGLEVAALKTFYKSNRTQMSRLKKSVGKSGDGTDVLEDLSATDRWIWENFSFLKDHIETVERRNVVSIHGTTERDAGRTAPTSTSTGSAAAVPPTAASNIQSNFGSESQSTDPSSRRHYKESADLKQTLMEYISGSKKVGSSPFARHIDEGLAELPSDIRRTTQIKLMTVLHEGQKQAEERQEMQQQVPSTLQHTFRQQQQQVAPFQPNPPPYLPSSTSRHDPSRLMSQNHQWQPPPSQWPTQMTGQQTSLWRSQDPQFMSSQFPAMYSQRSLRSPVLMDLDTGTTRPVSPIPRSSTPFTDTSSQGHGAAATAAADKTTDSLNLTDIVNSAITAAGISTRPPSPLRTPPGPEDDTTKK